MAQTDVDVFVRLERFYDAVPRPYAHVEEFGDLVLFVREGEGWPYYARPRLGAQTPSAADITAVRRRQRELGIPEAFEWVHESAPDLLAVARSAGLAVLLAPLLVLDPAALLPQLPVTGASIRVLDPDAPEFPHEAAVARAVARVGFGLPAGAAPTGELAAPSADGGLTVSVAGPAERDAAVVELDEQQLRQLRDRTAAGTYRTAVAESPTDGMLASGIVQQVGDVAEVAGVAVLPTARRRGYATQLTATLAREALTNGARLVFLSAGDDDIARLYSRVGFRRIGTACIAEPAPVAL